MTDTALEAGVKALETIAADVKARLRGEMADRVVAQAEADVVTKYRTEYQVDPPLALVRGRQRHDVDAYDAKVVSDLRAFQVAQDVAQVALERDAEGYRTLPDAVTERAALKRSDLNLTEEMAVRADERERLKDVRRETTGVGFDVVERRYGEAQAQNDRVVLRYLEAQAKAHWPGVTGADIEARERVMKAIQAAREARVPADVQEALGRVQAVWSGSFDGLARNVLSGRYPIAQVAFERHIEAAQRRRYQAVA